MDTKKLRATLLTIKLDMVYRGISRDTAEAKFRENVSVPTSESTVPPSK